MKLFEVIDRALEDEEFARTLRAKAEAAYEAGVNTDEWEDLMEEFAEDSQELARLMVPGSHGGPSVNSGTSITPITGGVPTIYTTLTTTTTTTTSYACPQFVENFVQPAMGQRRRSGMTAAAKTTKKKTKPKTTKKTSKSKTTKKTAKGKKGKGRSRAR